MATSGGSERFERPDVAFGLRRYTDGDKSVLWRFYVARYCGQPDGALLSSDVTVEGLRKMQHWIGRAIETIQSDGGRIEAEEKAEAA